MNLPGPAAIDAGLAQAAFEKLKGPCTTGLTLPCTWSGLFVMDVLLLVMRLLPNDGAHEDIVCALLEVGFMHHYSAC